MDAVAWAMRQRSVFPSPFITGRADFRHPTLRLGCGARRHKMKGRGTRRFSYDVVCGERGVMRLERLPWSLAPCALR